MATLSAPTIWEPVYECSSVLVLQGYLPGAALDIYAIPPGPGLPTRIGGGVSTAATGQTFGVSSAFMVAGARVYATQTFDGSISPETPAIAVQSASAVTQPELVNPLFDCAKCVSVVGMLPGAKAELLDGSSIIGAATAFAGRVDVSVPMGLVAGHTIAARQRYCGTPGAPSSGLMVSSLGGKQVSSLAAPEVKTPLYACQQYVDVSGCKPGAQVELWVNGVRGPTACASSTTVTIWVSTPLTAGTTITAIQRMCGTTFSSDPSEGVVVESTDAIPRPGIRVPLYEGGNSVTVALTVAGEVMTVSADGIQIGAGGATGGDSALFVDPPLVAGQIITATVELCDVSRSSLPVVVSPRPEVINPPSVGAPLYACASQVLVTGCIEGAEVRVYAVDGDAIVFLGTSQTLDHGVAIDVTPLLQKDWKVNATQTVGGISSAASASVEVGISGPPPTPQLRRPIYECARCVLVEGTLPGALLDVYQDDVWVGGGIAEGETASVDVYPGFVANAVITATQSLCGKTSSASPAPVVSLPKNPPAPTIIAGFPGDSHVTVTDLTPGAVVQIEETSFYGLVVGEACASGPTISLLLTVPLFGGAILQARQQLCGVSDWSDSMTVPEPPEWPLGDGPYPVGFRLVTVPVSSNVQVGDTEEGTATFDQPANNPAIVFYPATTAGKDSPMAAGGPFPLVLYGHGRRIPPTADSFAAVCAGAPADTTHDYQQLSTVLSHLATWGIVSISPDLSWLAIDNLSNDWDDNWNYVLRDAMNYMLAQSGDGGSPFHTQIRTTGLGIMGHSTGGAAAISVSTKDQFPIDAMALIAPAAGMNEVLEFAPNPVLVLNGTEDISVFGAHGQPVNIYAAAAAVKYLVTIDGANHFGYTDSLCLVDDDHATILQADQRRIGEAYISAFFRRHLQGVLEEEPYLTGLRQVEELESFGIAVEYSE